MTNTNDLQSIIRHYKNSNFYRYSSNTSSNCTDSNNNQTVRVVFVVTLLNKHTGIENHVIIIVL